MTEKELTPENYSLIYKQKQKEKELQELKEKESLERKLNQICSELFQEIDCALKAGDLPITIRNSREIIKYIRKKYSNLGWSCSTSGIEIIHLTIDFPGPIARLWRHLKNFFLSFFRNKSKLLLQQKSIYRD